MVRQNSLVPHHCRWLQIPTDAIVEPSASFTMSLPSAARRHVCATCTRSFAKAEHLARHQRSHTGDKPYTCEHCGSQFSRPDSLSRHFKRSGHPDRQLSRSRLELDPPQPEQWTWNEEDTAVPPTVPRPDPTFYSGTAAPGMVPEEQIIGDPFLELNWPDSEDLLQAILNNHIEPLPDLSDSGLPAPFPTQSSDGVRSAVSPWLPQSDNRASGANNEAVRNVSQIIINISSDVTSEAESASLSPIFLDECLHLFFDQFIPTFPVVHRPTFEYREWVHPLLLNAIAIGSLFLGEQQHIAQGEALWKLAHVAVATSWHALIQHRSPPSNSRGVQLVATALLGQTYAMLSRNRKLRMTAQMFHSLGFYWAHECGMYALKRTLDSSSNLWASDEHLLRNWRTWAAEESQLRVLLGHYVLDCQLAHFIHAPSSQRHSSNSLPLPCSDKLFNASSARAWAAALELEIAQRLTFRELVLALYKDPSDNSSLPQELSAFTLQVLVECLYSVILEYRSANGPVLGVPSPATTAQALSIVHTYINNSCHLSAGNRSDLLLRWHSVSIELLGDTVSICQELCAQHQIEQKVFPNGFKQRSEARMSPETWVTGPHARLAALHSRAICEQLDALPFSKATAVHLAMTIFTAAVVYCAHVLNGVVTIVLPDVIDWTHVTRFGGLVAASQCGDAGTASSPEMQDSPVGVYVLGGSRGPPDGRSFNLLYELKVLMIRLRQIGQLWGICAELEEMIRRLLASRGSSKQA
jgi:hypothetical protein